MKGFIKDIIAASAALQFMEIKGAVPFKTVRDLNKIKKALEEESRIASEAQLHIVKDLGCDPDKNGMVFFSSEEKKSEFEAARDDVLNTEVTLDVDIVDLSAFADNIVFHSSAIDIDALSKFFKFDSE